MPWKYASSTKRNFPVYWTFTLSFMKLDCYKVMLMTGRRDEATLRFYEAAGFSRNAKQAFVAKHPDAG